MMGKSDVTHCETYFAASAAQLSMGDVVVDWFIFSVAIYFCAMFLSRKCECKDKFFFFFVQ